MIAVFFLLTATWRNPVCDLDTGVIKCAAFPSGVRYILKALSVFLLSLSTYYLHYVAPVELDTRCSVPQLVDTRLGDRTGRRSKPARV